MLTIKALLTTRPVLSAAPIAALAILAVTASVQSNDAHADTSTIVADEEAGAELYNSVCKGCHGVSIAPTLRGVVGRPIASVASFGGYSDALKAKASLAWTEENLDAFLAAPGEFAPGTQMTQSVPDAQRRADLIAYLATLPPPRNP